MRADEEKEKVRGNMGKKYEEIFTEALNHYMEIDNEEACIAIQTVLLVIMTE